MTEQRPSGWYDDPDDPSLLRYWDGILWSERTMPKVKPGLERSTIGSPPPVPSAQERAAAEADRRGDRGHGGARSYGRGAAPGGNGTAGQRGAHGQVWGPPDPQQRQPGPNPGTYPAGPPRPAPPPVRTAPDGQVLSGIWRRVFALLLDNILTTLIAIPISWYWLSPWVHSYLSWAGDLVKAAQTGARQPSPPEAVFQFPWQTTVITALLYVVYDTVMVTWRGQSIGKMITRIKVRHGDGSDSVPLPAALQRSVVKLISNLVGAVPLLALAALVFQVFDYVRAISDSRRQTLHDLWNSTYVVRTAPPRTQQWPPAPGGPYRG